MPGLITCLVVWPVRVHTDDSWDLRPGQVLPGMANAERMVSGVKNLENLGRYFLITLQYRNKLK